MLCYLYSEYIFKLVFNVLIQIDRYLRENNLFELGIRPSNNFVKAQLALAMSQGVTLTLSKEKFISVVEMVVNEVFHTELDDCLVAKSKIKHNIIL